MKCVLGKKSQKISAHTLCLRPIRPQNLVVSPKCRWHEGAEREYSQNWGFQAQFTTVPPTHCARILKPTSNSDVSPSRLWQKCERNSDTTNGSSRNPRNGLVNPGAGSPFVTPAFMYLFLSYILPRSNRLNFVQEKLWACLFCTVRATMSSVLRDREVL